MRTSTQFFFIRGHPRSGTNWLASLLNLHPRICVEGEFHFQNYMSEFLSQCERTYTPYHIYPITRTLGEEGLRNFFKLSMSSLLSIKPEAIWMGDRSPSAMEVLPLPLDSSKYFFIIRDPRDVIVSWMYHCILWAKKLKRTPFIELFDDHVALFEKDNLFFETYPEKLLDHDQILESICNEWKKHVESFLARTNERYADTSIKLVKYENLYANLENVLPSLYEFLSLKPEEAEVPSVKTRTIPGFTSNSTTSFYRSGKVGEWSKYFTEHQLEIFEKKIGHLARRFGYE